MLAGIAAAAAAFFYAVYGAITTGRKKRSDPSSFVHLNSVSIDLRPFKIMIGFGDHKPYACWYLYS